VQPHLGGHDRVQALQPAIDQACAVRGDQGRRAPAGDRLTQWRVKGAGERAEVRGCLGAVARQDPGGQAGDCHREGDHQDPGPE
jgi:hypothetical protein